MSDHLEPAADLSFWQRLIRRRLLRLAGKRRGEPLTPEDWQAYFALNAYLVARGPVAVPVPPHQSAVRCLRCVYDFTAIGDVVNSASRLEGQAGGGEILLSSGLAERLDELPGDPIDLELKGKAGPVAAYRATAR